ncbi:hypothetical protein PENTCL1PPCAC_8674, partial [Pristionchus entomophagus]
IRDGECRGLYVTMNLNHGDAVNTVVAKCKEIQGLPIIIHDQEHQSYWANWPGKKYNGFTIGLKCNTGTKLWEWVDGSPLDYKPPVHDSDLNVNCKTGCSWYAYDTGEWKIWCDSKSYAKEVFCTTQLHRPVPSTNQCESFDADVDDGVCYHIGVSVENWQDAQVQCRNNGANLASIHNFQENSFVRRLAVSKGAVNGVYLGGTLSGKGKDGFGWIDGSEWDYENFYPGFPMAGLGDCLFLDTFGASGQWMNVDCASKLDVACARQPNASIPDVCSAGPWSEGQIIYTPGYPYDASVPCDFFLTVAAGKRIEVKVQLLEANTCCDRLVLSDNYFGGNIVANLTGEISGKTYTTKSSNLMRVSWNPNGGTNVRGAMVS